MPVLHSWQHTKEDRRGPNPTNSRCPLVLYYGEQIHINFAYWCIDYCRQDYFIPLTCACRVYVVGLPVTITYENYYKDEFGTGSLAAEKSHIRYPSAGGYDQEA